VVLIVAYALSLLFSLVTHKDLHNPKDADGDRALHGAALWGCAERRCPRALDRRGRRMSEILVGAVEQASLTLGLTNVFVGVIVVAIVATPLNTRRPS